VNGDAGSRLFSEAEVLASQILIPKLAHTGVVQYISVPVVVVEALRVVDDYDQTSLCTQPAHASGIADFKCLGEGVIADCNTWPEIFQGESARKRAT
jgi:hypothetical protein